MVVVEDTVKGVAETIGVIAVIRVYASPPAYHNQLSLGD